MGHKLIGRDQKDTTMHISRFATVLSNLALVSSTLHDSPLTSDYGHWNLELYETWAPSGVYRYTSTWSQYWSAAGTAGPIVYCADEWSPDGRGHVHTPCNDTSFSCTLLGEYYPPESMFFSPPFLRNKKS